MNIDGALYILGLGFIFGCAIGLLAGHAIWSKTDGR